ncbi:MULTISPECIES: membrane protein insertion efficiency factor YidD [Subtercola]|uniref:Putative membrane protein insertion efficiency factor n=1 Tax=Subtercola vilae TaxID=2056433 RepID=A0A4T2C9H6_9MICO|nr:MULTISPECIES: membrane protein insertion efficiency factor YidD [Subtercola]MEA9985386.1 membrane protein insertion efficiency factor YidD [Subtercola sp. RTI3]TIH40870.1 membrane protein insertion efficiency factor YidD [Subtercola vilae]
MKAVALWVFLVPRNLAVLFLRFYRAVISPLYGDVCRYYPSCSSYTLQAIQQRGLVMGSVLGIYRIIRCHPWAAGGIDDVPPARKPHFRVTRFGFVVASSQGKG